jgi:site-specific DNA-methyltransferase (adenine-specific)
LKPYYSHAGITIYHGDCREILPTLPPVDLVLTDPPYETEAHTLQRRVQREADSSEYGRRVAVEELPFGPMTPELRDESARLIAGHARAWVLTFCQIEGAPIWRETYEKHGLTYRRTCIWVKPDGMPQYSGDRPGMGYEAFVAMHRPGGSTWNGGGRHGVFTHNKAGSPLGNEHPTQKPQSLMRELVRLFSNENDKVLDPFAGSGSALVAAKNLNRNAIGIEIEERYCEIAAKRLSQEVFNFSEASS